MDYNGNLIQQGWQCPICKRVYAPSTPMCWYCNGESKTKNDILSDLGNTIGIKFDVDKVRYDPTVKGDEE